MAGAVFGILSTIVKFAYEAGYSAAEVMGAQISFGFAIQLILVLLFSRKKLKLKKIGTLMLVGLTSSGTGILYYACLLTIPASIAIVLLFQFTWIGILIEAIATRRRPDAGKIASLIVLLGGTLLAAGLLDGAFSALSMAGIGLGLLSALTYALFIFFSGKAATDVPPLNRSFFMVTGGMLLVFAYYPPTFLVSGVLFDGLWKYALLLALFGAVIPTLFLNIGTPKVGTGLATILSSSELPVAIIASAVILREPVSLLQWFGVILIFVGIAIPQLPRFRAKNAVASS